ncbi:hypothetical protein [Pseudomonas sp. OA65]|uniref:hypothetical protein n=1 Tax=Pseudomonas sp. OA65 TaxID=2818431 RepID=UPI001A9F1038|nr:hypothetical protein [Pseudomonas sp. OA65]MBO1541374.1 hypothetical protein [Pseudomonas sp. OA65]
MSLTTLLEILAQLFKLITPLPMRLTKGMAPFLSAYLQPDDQAQCKPLLANQ